MIRTVFNFKLVNVLINAILPLEAARNVRNKCYLRNSSGISFSTDLSKFVLISLSATKSQSAWRLLTANFAPGSGFDPTLGCIKSFRGSTFLRIIANTNYTKFFNFQQISALRS